MKTTPGPFAGQILGSVAGSTACHTGNGPVIRARSLGPSRKTARQMAQQARLGGQSARWRTLTEDQRTQWRAAAEANAIPGYREGLTGHALFVAVNIALRDAGLSARSVPSMASPGQITALADPVQVGTGGTFFLSWSRTNFLGARMVIRATSPAPPTLGESRNPVYRYLGTVQSTPFAANSGLWASAWWTGLSTYSGQAITWEFRVISTGGARGPVHRRVTILS